MSVLCGRCGQHHPTVADVRICHVAKPAKPMSPAKSRAAPRSKPQKPQSWVSKRDTPGLQLTYVSARRTTPTEPPRKPRKPRKDGRVRNVKQALIALAGFCEVSPSLDTLEAWSKDPWTRRIVGYRKQMLLEVMQDQTCPRILDLPKFLAQRLEARAKLASRDASMLLEGRREWKLSGGSRRPADAELHKRIGPVDFEGI